MKRLAGLLVALALLVPALPAHAATPTVTMFNSGIPDPATLLGITAAPDGKVWFADASNKALGAVTLSSGATNEIAVDRDTPVGVTAAPDGRLYYSEAGFPGIALSFVGLMNPANGNHGETWYGGGNNSMPRYLATGPDGNVWVTEPRDPSVTTGDDKIGLLDLSGNPDAATPTGPSIRNEIGGSGNPFSGDNQEFEAITAGPGVSSGTPTPMLWATEFNGGKILRLQPISVGAGGPNGTDGAIADEYILPTGGAGPEGITPGPDGNIWFTEFSASQVGRLVPPTSSLQGSPLPVPIDEFPLPAGSNPVGIAAGPDGNLWVALSGPGANGSVIRMDTSGNITGAFPTPQFQSPYMITPAADGNLWFTTFGGARVGKITTALDPPAFRNTAQINVPTSGQSGPASTYPSNVSVSGLQGTVTKVTVRLTGISHTFPDDLDILLEGPEGQDVMLASDVGSPAGNTSYPSNGITLNFDQSAARSLPDNDPLVSGFYRPTNNAPSESQTELITPAPPSPYGTSLGTFNGTDPNGTWRLFVIDDATHAQGNTNVGRIIGGWGLDIKTSTQLFVGKSGAGSGTVTSVPAGIDCGATCVSSFATGTPVVLTATPSTGSRFALWQGCDSVSGNQCTVNPDVDIKNVTASFELNGGASQTPANPTPTPAPKKKCKKGKKRSALAAKKCKKKRK